MSSTCPFVLLHGVVLLEVASTTAVGAQSELWQERRLKSRIVALNTVLVDMSQTHYIVSIAGEC
jgi:hypothetical protein